MFYLLHGEDEYSRSLELAKMKAKLGDPTVVDLNTTVLDGRKTTFEELTHVCDTVPFLSDKRLVIVNDLAARFERQRTATREGSEQDSALLQRLREYLSGLPDSARLVFLEGKKISKANPIYKLARTSEHGYEREFKPLRGAALDRWIADRAQEKGGQIEPAAVSLLAAFVGNDLRLLENEIEKLLTYVGESSPIREQDVRLLVSYVQEADIFQMVDALGRRDGRQAMTLAQAAGGRTASSLSFAHDRQTIQNAPAGQGIARKRDITGGHTGALGPASFRGGEDGEAEPQLLRRSTGGYLPPFAGD
jgi:DNA polymerase-3 subunit delta